MPSNVSEMEEGTFKVPHSFQNFYSSLGLACASIFIFFKQYIYWILAFPQKQ